MINPLALTRRITPRWLRNGLRAAVAVVMQPIHHDVLSHTDALLQVFDQRLHALEADFQRQISELEDRLSEAERRLPAQREFDAGVALAEGPRTENLAEQRHSCTVPS